MQDQIFREESATVVEGWVAGTQMAMANGLAMLRGCRVSRRMHGGGFGMRCLGGGLSSSVFDWHPVHLSRLGMDGCGPMNGGRWVWWLAAGELTSW